MSAALLLGAALVTGASVASVARAQVATPSDQKASAAQGFTDQELQSYAMAAVKVQQISKSAQEQIRASKDAKASDHIQQKAQEEAVAAVKQEGLTVQKYNQIALAMRTDPDVRSKIMDYVQKAK